MPSMIKPARQTSMSLQTQAAIPDASTTIEPASQSSSPAVGLTPEGCISRRRRLWDSLRSQCDAIVVSDPAHLIYLANFAPSPFSFRTSGASAALILRPGRATLVADNLLTPYADAAYVDEVAAPVWYNGRESPAGRSETVVEAALATLELSKATRLGIEPARVPAGIVEGARARRKKLDTVDVAPTLRRLRRTKDADELELMHASILAGEAGQAAALAHAAPGMTELDVYHIVNQAAIASVGVPVIVYGDFVVSTRGDRTGGPPTQRVIAPGDLFLLDYSVVVGGYRADFTNTFVIGGRPTGAQVELYQACMAALAAAEAALAPGKSGRELDAVARSVFAARGLEANWPSHLGHGLGLEHPEAPFLVREGDDILMPGDVVALEPGLYVAGVGGMRFEHNYLLTDDGCERLTRHQLTLTG